jgi:methylmalonyl-CoA mutase N-terminal domain/subunit
MTARFKATNPRSLAFRFHVQTAGAALTAQQPLNNIARASWHALSAVLGGAQSVHVDGYDEALCTPTERSSLTALRTSQILQLETRVTHTIDPLAGSYFVECLTAQLDEKIDALLEEIDAMGGIVRATESGWVHKEIADSAYAYQRAVESGVMPVVGVNCYQMEEELPIELFEVPDTVQVQEKKLSRIKKERNGRRVQQALDSIAQCCEADGNLMEIIVESVKELVTEGEISRTLKRNYGTWNPPLF